jgi:hypothetical protein
MDITFDQERSVFGPIEVFKLYSLPWHPASPLLRRVVEEPEALQLRQTKRRLRALRN